MSGINPTTKPVQPLATDDINTLLVRTTHAINAQARLGWAFAPSAQDTPNMTVAIAAGAILSGSTRTEVAAQSTATITAPATHPRIDLVVVDKTTGAVSVVAGAEGASPSEPALPAGKLPVALVALSVGMTAITNSNITDVRVGGGSGPELAPNLLSPSADAAPSTQAVVDDLDNIRAMAMFNSFLAQLSSGRSSGAIPGGYMHLFATDELATKTNATYDSTNKRYYNATGPTAISQSSGTAIGNANTGAKLLNGPFDGVTNQTGAQGGYTTTTPAYIGKSWGTPTIVIGFTATAFSDFGFTYGGNELPTLKLLGSNTNNPGTATELLTTTLSGDAGGQVVTQSDASISTAYLYHWLKIINSSNNSCGCAECVFLAPGISGNMVLIPAAITAGASPTLADIYLLHKAVDGVTLNTDLKARASRDNGANWSGFVTLAEVCQFDANYKLLRGTADLSALASGTNIKWEITTFNNKSQQIRAVAMQLR